jgi:hypothetical protein
MNSCDNSKALMLKQGFDGSTKVLFFVHQTMCGATLGDHLIRRCKLGARQTCARNRFRAARQQRHFLWQRHGVQGMKNISIYLSNLIYLSIQKHVIYLCNLLWSVRLENTKCICASFFVKQLLLPLLIFWQPFRHFWIDVWSFCHCSVIFWRYFGRFLGQGHFLTIFWSSTHVPNCLAIEQSGYLAPITAGRIPIAYPVHITIKPIYNLSFSGIYLFFESTATSAT